MPIETATRSQGLASKAKVVPPKATTRKTARLMGAVPGSGGSRFRSDIGVASASGRQLIGRV